MPSKSFLLIFLVFLALFQRFYCINMYQSRLQIFGFFRMRFFSYCSLSLHFYKNVIRQAIVFRVTKIQVLNYSIRFKAGFGFSINWSLHYLFKTSECLVTLLYFDFDGRLKAFLEIADYCQHIWGPGSLKFNKSRLVILEIQYPVSNFF